MDYFSWRICEVNMAPGLLSESPQISSAPCEFLLVFPFSFIWIANYSSRSWIRERIFCSNEGRRYRLPPNSPARFHPSDIIEFGSDKKVIYIKHHCYQFGIHFTYNLSSITYHQIVSFYTRIVTIVPSTHIAGCLPGEGDEKSTKRCGKNARGSTTSGSISNPVLCDCWICTVTDRRK